jgi:hypothetical protein
MMLSQPVVVHIDVSGQLGLQENNSLWGATLHAVTAVCHNVLGSAYATVRVAVQFGQRATIATRLMPSGKPCCGSEIINMLL